MKKLSYLAILSLFGISVLWISCSKEDVNQQIEVTESIDKKNVALEVISYTIPEDDLIEELETLMLARTDTEFQNHQVQIKSESFEKRYTITILKDIDIDIDDTPSKVVFAGSWLAFSKCVGAWMKANEGKCVVIRYDSGSGTYTADDSCQ